MKKISELSGNLKIPGVQKLLRVMKLTVFFILISVVTVMAGKTYSQTKTLTLKMEQASLKEVLAEIENQSEFRIMYSGKFIDVDRKVSVSVNDKKIEAVLNLLFAETDVGYTIRDKFIVLTTPESINYGSFALFQQHTVSGKVTDIAGQPLPGVSIVVKGTTQGTVTDVNGNYSLSDIPADAILVFSFVGMRTQEIAVGNRISIDLSMEEETIGIEEVVAVGYGTQKKVNLTGSIDVISNERLINRSAPTVSQLLSGTSSGLFLDVQTRTGRSPGTSMNINIRGKGSLTGGQPYILIDGVEGSIDDLNPEDIESISVLKDAASSAIYGAKAPYGVILVLTKSGKRSEKFSVSYSNNITIAKAAKQYEFLDSYTWSRIQNEAGNNLGGPPVSNYTMDLIIAYQNEEWDWIRNAIPDFPEDADVRYGSFPIGNKWDNAALTFANNDWWDIYLGTAINQKHDLSFQGGSDKASYYFSAGYLAQEGVLNYVTDIYQRINFTGKVEVSLTDWWNFSYQGRFARKNREMPNSTNEGDYDQLFRLLARAYPFTPVYTGHGDYNIESLIPTMIYGGTDRIEDMNYWNYFETEIRPIKGWKINANYVHNNLKTHRIDVEKHIPEHMVDKTITIFGTSIPNNVERTITDRRYYTTNIYSSYEFFIDLNHQFNIMAGMQFEKGLTNSLNGYKTDMIVEAIPALSTASGSAILRENLSHNATQGYFSRLNYNFKEKYLIESNVRYDGAYVFRRGNRWGFFPSFALGWNVNKETFWTIPENYIGNLKFRASWGQLGNQQISPYTDIELMPITFSQLNWIFDYGTSRTIGFTGAPSIVNRNLTWETATTKNLGVDLTLLNNKLQTNFDVFERLTTDMVGPSEAKPGVLGAGMPKDNNSSLQTRGWELGLNWKDRFEMGLSYFVNLNLSDYKMIVKQYVNPTGILSTWYEGARVGDIWGYTVNDLFRSQKEIDEYLATTDASFIAKNFQPGDVRYEDINNDGFVNRGKYTIHDHGDLKIIGNNEPQWIFGIGAGADYKGIDFSMLWSGIAKRDIYLDDGCTLFWGFWSGWYMAQLSYSHLDYFRDKPGTKYSGLYEGEKNINLDAYWPKPYLNGTKEAQNKRHANTRYLTSGKFLRMKNIQIGYTLPQKVVSKLFLQNARIFLSGENLITFTPLPTGIDPEALIGYPYGGALDGLGRGTYPGDRMISLGLTIKY